MKAERLEADIGLVEIAESVGFVDFLGCELEKLAILLGLELPERDGVKLLKAFFDLEQQLGWV